jgi:hypothetical protein
MNLVIRLKKATSSEIYTTLYIDKIANQAATSEQNKISKPTENQIKAGNYKKGHINLHGLRIAIENPAGSYREGTDKNGKKWRTKLAHHYGYLNSTVGSDKDHVDVFLGPNASDPNMPVIIVNQVDPQTGKFDEHKVMIGFDGWKEACEGYLKNYSSGWNGIGSIKVMELQDFKKWIRSGKTTSVLKSINTQEIQPLRMEAFIGSKKIKRYKEMVKKFYKANPGKKIPHHIKKMEQVIKRFETHYKIS